MGNLLLVRHGQASFGADDYDHLKPLGVQQCERLGAWLQAGGRRFDGVLRGTLRRHRQSLDAIASQLPGLPEALEWPGLDEYDSEALVRAVRDLARDPLPPSTTPEGYREHFRALRDGLQAWIEGRSQPRGMPTWPEFLAGVTGALDHVRTQFEGDVLIVSSGGPISTAVAHVMGAPPLAMVELNLRLRNAALTEFLFSRRRHTLHSFNALPHLEHPATQAMITFA